MHYKGVYYVENSTYKHELEPIAIEPQFTEGKITWKDNSMRGHEISIPCSDIILTPSTNDNIPTKIKIVTQNQEEIVLVPLTLAIYDQNVKRYVAKQPVFSSEEQLQAFYLNNNFQSY